MTRPPPACSRISTAAGAQITGFGPTTAGSRSASLASDAAQREGAL